MFRLDDGSEEEVSPFIAEEAAIEECTPNKENEKEYKGAITISISSQKSSLFSFDKYVGSPRSEPGTCPLELDEEAFEAKKHSISLPSKMRSGTGS